MINPAGWVAKRRIIVWFSNTREELFAHFGPLDAAWNAVKWAWSTVFGGAAVPLIWLAVAGIVYGVTLKTDWRGMARRVAGGRVASTVDRSVPVQQRWQTRVNRVPKALRDKSRDHAVAQLGKFRPIADSARVVVHGGVLALALYVLAYAGLAYLDMTGSFYRAQIGDGYLLRGVAWLLGPHPLPFWRGYQGTISVVSHLLIETLRIALIASTFAYCVEHAAERQATAQAATTPAAT